MMAENKNRGSSTTNFTGNEVQIACAETKKRPNILRKNADRLKSRLSRSPKRRAGTPEPEQRVFTDESEKDTSDGENLGKTGEPSSDGIHDERGKQNAGIRRFITRRDKKVREERSRSLEKTLYRDNESEDDFETIRKMHKSKELEEEKKENEKMAEDSKPRGKEEPKAYVLKDMPPLIEAPKDAKRKRHKSLPSQDFFLQGEAPRTPILKQKIKLERRKSSSSEEDRERGIDKCRTSGSEASQTGRKPSVSDLRKRRSPSNPDVNIDLKETVGIREPDGALPGNKEESTKPKKLSFFSRIFSRPKDLEKLKVQETEKKTEKNEKAHVSWTVRGVFKEWKAHVNEHRDYINRCQKLKNRCITDLFILLFICGCGGLIFRFVEGAFESFYKCGVKRVKRDFIDSLWKYSQYMLEEDWKSQARRRLMEFENQLHSAHEAGMTTYSGQKSWSFLNAVVYCLTIVTTIGYGHISPSTTTGRAITIIYAIFGIPMFLILLADFGKLFTRGIKFLWAFVRRLYYTGSCRKVRKTAPVQEMMKGMQIMYDFAKTRKFSNAGLQTQDQHLRPPEPGNIQCLPETPGTPNWSNYEIDDEFNLPISVAISILLTYIFFGAFLYWMWEDWSFFESFYFVFISMSTIGFGDFVPQHPIYMMLSIVYLVFGLALTSMCINVVQEKLSDTFRQASAKLGTTIGLSVDEPVGVPQASLRPESNEIKPQ